MLTEFVNVFTESCNPVLLSVYFQRKLFIWYMFLSCRLSRVWRLTMVAESLTALRRRTAYMNHNSVHNIFEILPFVCQYKFLCQLNVTK